MLLAGPIFILAFSAWISSKLSMFHWICLLFILLILAGIELALHIVFNLFLESS